MDLLLSYSEASVSVEELPVPRVTLLEYNASPDFHQTGERLRPLLLDLFKGVIRISVAPFFSLKLDGDDDAETRTDTWVKGEQRWGWTLVGQGAVRGPTVQG